MMDQRAAFTFHGIAAEFVGGTTSDLGVERKVLKGDAQLVFITPEKLLDNQRYRSMLLSKIYQDHLVALVVDEAHCVKTWGEDFRTAFSRIGELRSLLRVEVKLMALTATATTETFHVVVQRLGMREPSLIALPPSRDNILYSVKPKIELKELASLLSEEIVAKKLSYPKTILFVRQFSDCYTLYRTIRHKMGKSFTEPVGYPDDYRFRMVRVCPQLKKKNKFLKPSSCLQQNSA